MPVDEESAHKLSVSQLFRKRMGILENSLVTNLEIGAETSWSKTVMIKSTEEVCHEGFASYCRP